MLSRNGVLGGSSFKGGVLLSSAKFICLECGYKKKFYTRLFLRWRLDRVANRHELGARMVIPK